MIDKYFYIAFNSTGIDEVAVSVDYPETEGRHMVIFDMNVLSVDQMLELCQTKELRRETEAAIKLFFR